MVLRWATAVATLRCMCPVACRLETLLSPPFAVTSASVVFVLLKISVCQVTVSISINTELFGT